jgi:hypothetical protein
VNNTVDRTRLSAIVERYREALATRNPHKLPLSGRVRYTENMQVLPLPEGLWSTATGTEEPQLVLLDEVNASAAILGLAHEHGQPVGIGTRIRLEGDEVTEVESLVVREGSMIFRPEGMRGTPPNFGPVAPASRASREHMRAAADSYFNGIEQNSGEIIPHAPDCVRVENGVQTVLAPASNFGSSTAEQGLNLFEMGLHDQMESGFFDYIPRVRSRRFPVIDEDQSVVLGMCCFDQPGTVTKVMVKDVGEIVLPPMFRRPTSVGVFETFQVADGKIRTINAVFDFYQYGIQPNWPV